MSESIWSDVVSKSKTKPRGGNRPPPAGRPQAQVVERAGRITLHLIVPQMSSDRLFLDRVARQHCPSPLHRHAQTITHPHPARRKPDISTLQGIGHFYFALTFGEPANFGRVDPPRSAACCRLKLPIEP